MTHEERVRAARDRYGRADRNGYVNCEDCPLYAAGANECGAGLLDADDYCNGWDAAWEAIARWQERQEANNAQPRDAEQPSQGAKADAGKVQLTLCPPEIIKAIARVRMFGTIKYGDRDNWQMVEAQRYRDAAYRHWLAYLADPCGVDDESGLPHLWHLACNVAFLIELREGDHNGSDHG